MRLKKVKQEKKKRAHRRGSFSELRATSQPESKDANKYVHNLKCPRVDQNASESVLQHVKCPLKPRAWNWGRGDFLISAPAAL